MGINDVKEGAIIKYDGKFSRVVSIEEDNGVYVVDLTTIEKPVKLSKKELMKCLI